MKGISIKGQFLWAIIAIVAVVILIFIFTFNDVFQTVASLTSENAVNSVSEVADKINYLITDIDKSILPLLYSRNVLAHYEGQPGMSDVINAEMQQVIAPYRAIGIEIVMINTSTKVIASTKNELVGTYRILGSQWINKIYTAKGKPVLISGYTVGSSDKGTLQKVICAARAISSYDGKLLGILMVEIPIEVLAGICERAPIGNLGFFAILDTDNFVIYHTNNQQMGSQQLLAPTAEESQKKYYYRVINDTYMLVTNSKTENAGFLVMGFMPYSQIRSSLKVHQSRFIVLVLVAGAIALAYAYFVSRGISKPIFRLQNHMKKLEKGDFSVRIHSKRTNEIGQLENGFDDMAQRLQTLIDTVYKSKIQENEARFQALVSTVNPHFIYNTLESISMTAFMKDDYQVVEMIGRLADILRSSINVSTEEISVKEEIEHISNYVYLKLINNPELFTIVYDIEEGLETYKILQHLLQPLVENSIIHGFNEMDSKGLIEINIARIANSVTCIVRDNGKGFDSTRLESLLAAFEGKCVPQEYSALYNINERIQLKYGSFYGLTIHNGEHCGAVVEILLPFYTEERRANIANESINC